MVLSYGVFYLIPAMIITGCSHWFLSRLQKQNKSTKLLLTEYAIAILSTSVTLILLFADRVVFRLFNFHLNGFVWNLITTPGGIESMGGSSSTSLTYGVICFGIVCLHIGILFTCHWLCQHKRIVCIFSKQFQIVTVIIFIIMGIAQALIYGVSSFKNNLPIINMATALPLYQPLTMKSLAKKLGIKPPPTNKSIHLKAGEGNLHYPLEPLIIKKKDQPLNIVWLIAESWRADMLTPEIMPNMSSFATQANNFHQHYSGGNGTRMGLFSQFYGLYGTYWFQFLNERQSPVIMDVLQQQDYQISLYTSAKFSYPEFDKTLFAAIPPEKLHEVKNGTNWQKDRTNVTNMLSFIKKRDTSRLPMPVIISRRKMPSANHILKISTMPPCHLSGIFTLFSTDTSMPATILTASLAGLQLF
jgi:membrane-anchored protein YejM (alkaline phosphatase superfamily)